MKLKKVFLAVSIFLLSFGVFAQESDESFVIEEEIEFDPPVETFQLRPYAFFMNIGPVLMINTDDSTKSAPSPIMYSLGFGSDFFQDRKVCAQARLGFFTNYYLWDGENAQPAEIENRTATAFSFMIDALAGHIWKKGMNQLTASGGLGILARFAMLSSGGDAEMSDDVSSINSWFYSNLNFLYPEISVSYLRAFPSLFGATMFGGEFRAYFSMGGIINGDFFDGMMFSLAAKIQF